MQITQQVRVDPNEVDELEGCKRWECVVMSDDERLAWLAIDRLPLHTDEDIILQADYDMHTPHEAVFAVCDGYVLRPHVAELLPRTPRDVMEWGHEPSILIATPPEAEPEWQLPGVEELLLARLLAEVQILGDVLCAVQLAVNAKGSVRQERDRLRSVFSNLAFIDLPRKRDMPGNVMLMPDWGAFHQARSACERRFGFLPSPQIHWT